MVKPGSEYVVLGIVMLLIVNDMNPPDQAAVKMNLSSKICVEVLEQVVEDDIPDSELMEQVEVSLISSGNLMTILDVESRA